MYNLDVSFFLIYLWDNPFIGKFYFVKGHFYRYSVTFTYVPNTNIHCNQHSQSFTKHPTNIIRSTSLLRSVIVLLCSDMPTLRIISHFANNKFYIQLFKILSLHFTFYGKKPDVCTDQHTWYQETGVACAVPIRRREDLRDKMHARWTCGVAVSPEVTLMMYDMCAVPGLTYTIPPRNARATAPYTRLKPFVNSTVHMCQYRTKSLISAMVKGTAVHTKWDVNYNFQYLILKFIPVIL
jgi:hypothetical protein